MKEYDAREVLKKFLKEQNETLVHVVELLNAKHPDKTTTSQNITNKLMRNTIRFNEVMEIVDVLGYEVRFQEKAKLDKDTKEETKEPVSKKDIEPHKKQLTAIVDRVNTPFTVCSGLYFSEILIIGERCNEAVLNINLRSSLEDEENEKKGMLAEILWCAYLENAFDVIIYPSGCEKYGKFALQ